MENKAEKLRANARDNYVHFLPITTRWADNDAYGHINNVVYYSFFDTVVNTFLINHGVLNPQTSAVIGLVIETHCNYFAPLAYPETIEAGLSVSKLGRSSVRYEVGIFKQGAAHAAAQGHFVHVYVDSVTRTPIAIPEAMREVLQTLQTASSV